MNDEQTTTTETTATKTEAPTEKVKATTKPARKAGKTKAARKAGKTADKKKVAAKSGGDDPLWKKMGWNKPGRKGAGKKAGKAAKATKATKPTKKAGKAVKATPAVSRALARSGTSLTDGSDVRSLLVAAIKRAVDTADYENARQILGLLEKQKR